MIQWPNSDAARVAKAKAPAAAEAFRRSARGAKVAPPIGGPSAANTNAMPMNGPMKRRGGSQPSGQPPLPKVGDARQFGEVCVAGQEIGMGVVRSGENDCISHGELVDSRVSGGFDCDIGRQRHDDQFRRERQQAGRRRG